jgi:hypothetical protein
MARFRETIDVNFPRLGWRSLELIAVEHYRCDTKLYARRSQKMLLEDMKKIRY